MGAYTKVHADWKDYPDTTTPVTQAALEQIEQGIADAHTEHIEKTLADAKGDLIVASAADTFGREPVGANDTALVADSAQTRGVKWTKIGNAQVADAAAIAYSKLNLAGSIVNADIAAAAGIDLSKLFIPSAKARRSAALSVANATWTLVDWTTEDYDNDTIHDNSTNPSRLTAKTAGKYQFNAFAEIAAHTAGIRGWAIQKNSITLPDTTAWVGGFVYSSPSTSITLPISASGVVDMAVNDYLVVVIYQNSGGSLNLQTESYFEMHRLSS